MARAGNGVSKQDAAMKAAVKKSASKENRRQWGYYLAIAVGLGSCIFAGVLAVTGSDSITPHSRRGKASQAKARKSTTTTTTKKEPFEAKGEILKAMQGFDVDNDGKISLDEIKTVSAPKLENMTKEDPNMTMQLAGWEDAFPKADSDKDGLLSAEEVADLVQKVTMRSLAAKMGGAEAEDADHKAGLALSLVLLITNPKAEEPSDSEDGEQPRKPKHNITAAAHFAIRNVMSSLVEGAEPPLEVSELKQSIEAGELPGIGSALYKLVVKQTLDFDMLNGTMSPSSVANKDAKDLTTEELDEIKKRMLYCYRYGVNMVVEGYFSVDLLGEIVVNRLASRMGMDGPSLERWLEVKGFLAQDEADNDTEAKTES
jgi:Ca2+-binding EF-hand superfamily protein